MVKCNVCGKEFSSLNEKMAAHLAGKTGLGIKACPNPTADAVALGEKVLAKIETKREEKSKLHRAREDEMAEYQQQADLRRSCRGKKGNEAAAADKELSHFIFAAGQSFGTGEKPALAERLKPRPLS